MGDKSLILDFSKYDLDNIVADQEAIRGYIPQRDAFEQLSAIVYDDLPSGICVGYLDVGSDAFWVSGHMPGLPIMPGVMMCEVAAQVCTYHVQRHGEMKVDMVGFGGLDKVRFRGMVFPGDRFVMVTEKLALRPKALLRSRFQGFVNQELVCEGEIRGVPLPMETLREQAERRSS